MKVIYDRETDTLTVIFSETPIIESDEDKPNVVLDYDKKGNLVSIEILDFSKQIKPQNITREFIRSLRGKYKGQGLMKALMKEKEFEKRY
jgi:uncharacterized protein YuzE